MGPWQRSWILIRKCLYIYIYDIYCLNMWFQFLCLGIMLLPKQVCSNIQRILLRIQAWTASFSAFLCPPILLNINPAPRNTKPISPEFTDWSILEPYWSRVEGNDPPFVLEEMVFWWYHHDFQQFFWLTAYYTMVNKKRLEWFSLGYNKLAYVYPEVRQVVNNFSTKKVEVQRRSR